MNLDSVEESIQNLLSVLYPPFESTAPTLLSQLFQIIDSRFQGDAHRCLLDFLIPAKNILDTVQQAACSQHSGALFLCEGWPLCLRDQVVIHLSPINPALLRPGDFYLRVAPFCDQSARIVVCSLLEEKEVRVEVVEETPISEASYTCIFSCDWLEEINRGRHGTPLSHCLLATEQGVVRKPWRQVALPEFVGMPQCSGSGMASASPSCIPLPHPLPTPPPHVSSAAAENSLSNLPPTFSPPKESVQNYYPGIIQSSVFPLPSHSSAFSVETRICPAKHGIAVSLCLVDTSVAPSSRLVKVKETEAEPKPIGWVSPNMWDSRFTGTAAKTSGESGSPTRTGNDANPCRGAEKGVPENMVQDNNKGPRRRESAVHTHVAEGEYIDILQASMLFGQSQALTDEKEKMQPNAQKNTQDAQMDLNMQIQRAQMPPPHARPQFYASAKPPTHIHPGSLKPNTCGEKGCSPHPHPDLAESPQCVRAVRFSEKPCTPCMRRRQGGKTSKAQELRCRYRESYQAAIQNPLTFGKEKERGDMFALVEEEDGVFSQRDEPPETETGNPWCRIQEMWCEPAMQNQHLSACKDSGENNTFPCWKPADSVADTSLDCRDTSAARYAGERTVVPLGEPKEAPCATNYGNSHSVNGTKIIIFPSSADCQQAGGISTLHRGTSALNMRLIRPQESPQNGPDSNGTNQNIPKSHAEPQNRRESDQSDGRCSSLSTVVVDTSEKCELVIVEDQIVRRQNIDSCSEIPRLHVVRCKNSTAFGLVSPKINRRNAAVPGGALPGSASVSSRDGHQTENQSPPAAETQHKPEPASARVRPDHLPLEPPDPRAHPLYLGVASLTGGRDRTGRPIVELYGHHQGWRPSVTSQELFQMLFYFYSITRRELRDAGMTLIFDARKKNPPPQLYKALMALQEQTPQALNSLVLLVQKENSHRPEKCPGIQTEVVTSMKSLLKLVDLAQLSCSLEGTLSHRHCDWTELHQKLFPFVSDLHEATVLLLTAIGRLEEPQRTDTVQMVQQCMMDQRTLMKDVLEDSRLVSLQREGGAILARLRKEIDHKYPYCENLSDAVESVTSRYNHMEEQAHLLVQRSNRSLEHLSYLLLLREMEGHFRQMQEWFHVEGKRHLLEAESVEDSGERMEQILNTFTGFLIEANDRRHHAMSLVSEAELLQQRGQSYPQTEEFRTLVSTFKSGLEDFLCRAEACGRELQIIVQVCDFCEQATSLANECKEYLDQNQCSARQTQEQNTTFVSQDNPEPKQHQKQNSGPPTASTCPSDIHLDSDPTSSKVLLSGVDRTFLRDFQDRFLQFSPEKFHEVKDKASALRSSKGMRVWNTAWLRCQEVRQQLQERIQDVDDGYSQQAHTGSWCEHHYIDVASSDIQRVSPGGPSVVLQSNPGPGHPQWENILSGRVALGRRKTVTSYNSDKSATVACCNIVKPADRRDAGTSQGSKVTPQSPHRPTRRTESDTRRRQATRRVRSERDAAALSQSHTVGCEWFPWRRGPAPRSVSEDPCTAGVVAEGSSTPPEQQVPPASSCSRRGQLSCRILQEAQKFQRSRHGSFCSEDSCPSERGPTGTDRPSCCKHSSLPVGRCDGSFCQQECSNNALRLQRVLEELVFTEREYVRSLGYILTHYLPLLDRTDVPQDLRGKRGVIFGNLEKLYDFHSRYFLPELEACQREPVMVARCFLRHTESFGLYALYSKNKPQSDALILHSRHDIFKTKQQELGDMMDLSSYLLRPVQRISKYSLLLQDMLVLVTAGSKKDAGVFPPESSSSERDEIQAAADLVRFQMRHGNDLLTMDAIQDCDVNLKEQGELIRQDEFTVFFRKKKCVRRVFLFEHLILFSKAKRTDIGNDVYVYKQSFKTSDVGMTQNSAVSSLCFEIWFRRRKSEDTYTLKASSMEVKKAWTTDLERILWDQAAHSRELRMQERVFMGVGHKPFMEIQHSEAAICDRAVSRVLPGKIPVACCSHRGVEYPRPHSIDSGSTASTTVSQSSSSSGRGSLPPVGCPGNQSQGLEMSPVACSFSEAVADNELNNHHLCQHHLYRSCEPWKTAHNHLMDSSESPEEYISLFSSSETSCLSAIGGELIGSSSSFVSESSKLRLPMCQTPSLKTSSSPVITRKKPGIIPRPHSQADDIIFGKSTEV